MEDTLRFEIWLAEISTPKEFRRNESELYNPVVLSEMESINGRRKISSFWFLFIIWPSLFANISSIPLQVNRHHGLTLLIQLSMMGNKKESILDQRIRYNCVTHTTSTFISDFYHFQSFVLFFILWKAKHKAPFFYRRNKSCLCRNRFQTDNFWLLS